MISTSINQLNLLPGSQKKPIQEVCLFSITNNIHINEKVRDPKCICDFTSALHLKGVPVLSLKSCIFHWNSLPLTKIWSFQAPLFSSIPIEACCLVLYIEWQHYRGFWSGHIKVHRASQILNSSKLFPLFPIENEYKLPYGVLLEIRGQMFFLTSDSLKNMILSPLIQIEYLVTSSQAVSTTHIF